MLGAGIPHYDENLRSFKEMAAGIENIV